MKTTIPRTPQDEALRSPQCEVLSPAHFWEFVKDKADQYRNEQVGDSPENIMSELRRKVFALASAVQSHQEPAHIGIAAEQVAALAFMLWKRAEFDLLVPK